MHDLGESARTRCAGGTARRDDGGRRTARPATVQTTLKVRHLTCWLLAGVLAGPADAQAPGPAAPEPIALRVVGGLAQVNQFTRHEEPFWTRELPRLSGGRLRAEIVPFDRAGLRGQDMLSLVRLGSVPFGTVLLSQASARDPELAAVDLAGLNPDMASLRRTVASFRPTLRTLLRERHGAELLALYTYPAQVLFCKSAFAHLEDLRGRRVRTSSVAQSDWVEALGGRPVATPMAEVAVNLRNGNVDCAITGTMTGYTLGLHELTSHVHGMAVNWGLSAFVVQTAAWETLPADARALLQRELARLEAAIWADADRETREGIECNTGKRDCGAARGRMTEVATSPADERRRREILEGTVLPRWAQRCGDGCRAWWDRTVGAAAGKGAPR